MGFFTARERAALGKSAEIRERGNVRELMRQDFTPPRRRPPANPTANPDVSNHVGTLVQHVSDSSLQKIDDLIARLQRRREQLLTEGTRIERAVVEYAKLNQITLESTRIITESLAFLRRVPDAPSMGEPEVTPAAPEEVAERHTTTAPSTQPSDEVTTGDERAEAAAEAAAERTAGEIA
jgi:hypothetical protein